MRSDRATYLLILGHRAGLAWVLGNSRMAFTEARIKEGQRLAEGDWLFLYTSRGCFGNPTRDRGRVIGEGEVLTTVRRRRVPLTIMRQEFTHDCQIMLKSLAPFGQGVVIADLVDQLEIFPDRRNWSFRLRRPLLRLPPPDATLIAREVRQVVRPVEETIDHYVEMPALAKSRLLTPEIKSSSTR
jgi:hypothetical protein